MLRRLPLAALAAALSVTSPARADEPPRTFADDPGLVKPPVTGERGLVLLADGGAVEGRIVVLEGQRAGIRVDPRQRSRETPPSTVFWRPRAALRGFVPLDVAAERPGEARVVLSDGSVLSGVVASRGEAGLVLDGPAGRRELPAERVRAVFPLEAYVQRAVRMDRYLEVRSADVPSPGLVRLAVLDGAHLVAGAGLAEHLAVEVGTALPFLHAADARANVDGALLGALALDEHLQVGAGFHLRAIRPGRYQGFLSGTVTAALPRVSLTLSGGPSFAGASGLADLGDRCWAAAAEVGLTPRLSLVGDLWVAARREAPDALAIGAVRARLGRLTVDAGATAARRSRDVGPWLGLTYDLAR